MRKGAERLLEARGLGRDYRLDGATICALKTVDIAVAAGEFVSIMGPSGSGKSTLLNLLGGLDGPTRGSVLIDGIDLARLGERELARLRRRTMGFVFQRHDLLPALTATENVEVPLLLDGLPEAERVSRVLAALDLVGLIDKAGSLPDELSGGQRQRVGIARALVNAPRIVLADEPTGNLDSATSAEIMESLVGLCRGSDCALVVVTHDPAVAALADRTLRFRDGEIVDAEGARP